MKVKWTIKERVFMLYLKWVLRACPHICALCEYKKECEQDADLLECFYIFAKTRYQKPRHKILK